jgi:hypothetical protein
VSIIHSLGEFNRCSNSRASLVGFGFVLECQDVPDSEEYSLKSLAKMGICPNCGSQIPTGTAVVFGPGSFCSLDCVAKFNSAEFSERARRLAAGASN